MDSRFWDPQPTYLVHLVALSKSLSSWSSTLNSNGVVTGDGCITGQKRDDVLDALRDTATSGAEYDYPAIV